MCYEKKLVGPYTIFSKYGCKTNAIKIMYTAVDTIKRKFFWLLKQICRDER